MYVSFMTVLSLPLPLCLSLVSASISFSSSQQQHQASICILHRIKFNLYFYIRHLKDYTASTVEAQGYKYNLFKCNDDEMREDNNEEIIF